MDPRRRSKRLNNSNEASRGAESEAADDVLLSFDVAYRGDFSVILRAPLLLVNRLPSALGVRWLSTAETVSGAASFKRIVAADTLEVGERRHLHLLASARSCALQLRTSTYDWSPVRAPFFVETLSSNDASSGNVGDGKSTARSRSGTASNEHDNDGTLAQSVASGARRAQFVCLHRDERGLSLSLYADIELHGASFVATIYAPWWLVNRVGQPLRYRTAGKRVLPLNAVAREARRTQLSHRQHHAEESLVDDNDATAVAGTRVVLYSDRRVAISVGNTLEHWSNDSKKLLLFLWGFFF